MSHFADTIHHLVEDENPQRRISAIKAAVIASLRATDERVHIAPTDHFNHSYVPDLILSWPGSSESRNVFLRTSFRAKDLLQDLDLLAPERPILMPLAPIRQAEYKEEASLDAKSSEQRILITDPYGLETLDRETEATPVVSILSHAILQGGRGVISSQRAQSISETVGAGFTGAQQANYSATSAAIEAAETALDPYRASQLNGLLHAVWIGSGAPSSQFPGATGITTSLGPEALKFILELPDLRDPEFWSRIGNGLTTERLCQLGDFPPNANLQQLIDGMVHRLYAKACKVVTADSENSSPRWEVTDGTLTLRGPQHRIHFAPKLVRDLPESSIPAGPVTVGKLQRRASEANVNIGEVRLTNGDSVITYGSEGRLDVSHDPTLAAVAAAIDGASVDSALARLGDGPRTVRCNLMTATAFGNSNAMYFVTELAAIAIPLVADIKRWELEEIWLKTRVTPSRENKA